MRDKILTAIMLWCGTRIYRFIQSWRPNTESETRVWHFAKSEADFNTACRQRVEYLDYGSTDEDINGN